MVSVALQRSNQCDFAARGHDRFLPVFAGSAIFGERVISHHETMRDER